MSANENKYEMNVIYLLIHLRIWQSLMDDMEWNIILTCNVSYTMKTDLHFQPTLSSLQNFKYT